MKTVIMEVVQYVGARGKRGKPKVARGSLSRFANGDSGIDSNDSLLDTVNMVINYTIN